MESIYATFEDARRSSLRGLMPWVPALLPMQVGSALRQGLRLPDREFDRFLPRKLRRLSSQHWTPLLVVARAMSWLEEAGVRTVVDIGSGAGKFCVAGALFSRCTFVGIEQRADLVSTARVLSRLYGVQDRAVFLHECFGQIAPPAADAYYLFNPFGENLFTQHGRVDDAVELGPDRFERELEHTGNWLEAAPQGTYVVTYNGFGAEMPCSYTALRVARDLPCVLKLWRQDRLAER
jgi:hypothetical protein